MRGVGHIDRVGVTLAKEDKKASRDNQQQQPD